MAEKSGVRLRFDAGKLPFLEGARRYAEEGLFPGGACNNELAYQHAVQFAPEIDEETRRLLYTPETSGGLLAALPRQRWEALSASFAAAQRPCWLVGEVLEGAGIVVAPD